MEEENKSKKMTTVLKQRDSNLELYRIIVMLSIVAHHYVVNSGLIDLLKEDPLSTRSIFYYLFGAWGKTGINCFVLITGYYMCKSNITLRKYLKLFFEVLFYSIVINATLIFFGKEQVTLEGIWRNLQIFFDLSYGFTSCFLMFYLFIPFLNILVRNMKRGQHFNLIMLCLIIYTGISTFVLGKVEMNYVVWFSILFIISSYIRLYEPMQKVPWGGVCLGGALLSIVSVVTLLYIDTIYYIHPPFMSTRYMFHFIADSNKLLAVVLSISLFMYFKKLHIPTSKIINRLAMSCFGVLLIHANSDAMRQWLWCDFLEVKEHYYSDSYIIYSVFSVFGIYVVCTIIDQIRIFYIERPLFKWLDKYYKLTR